MCTSHVHVHVLCLSSACMTCVYTSRLGARAVSKFVATLPISESFCDLRHWWREEADGLITPVPGDVGTARRRHDATFAVDRRGCLGPMQV